MRVRTICFLLTILLFEKAFNQNTYTLSGIVTEINGEPLIGATIVIKNLQIGTTTNAKGMFTIASLPKGTHVLEASYIGYNTVYDTIELNSNYTIKLVLQPNVVKLEEVVVRENYKNIRNTIEALSI